MSYTDHPLDNLAAAMAHAAYEAFSEYHYRDRDWNAYGQWRATLTREQMKTAEAPDTCWVEKTRRHQLSDITVVAMFPQTWSSTALGHGGVGGQAITTAYTVVLGSNLTGEHAVYFGGQFAYMIGRAAPLFFEHMAARSMHRTDGAVALYQQPD